VTLRAELLDWDSRFFGVRVARVMGHALDVTGMAQVLDWCALERIDCLYFLADANSAETVALAEKHAFGLKDVRVTYHRHLEPSPVEGVPMVPPSVRIRPCRPADALALEAIAEGSYTDSRFYYDGRFPRHAVAELYRTWVRQSIAGQADAVLVLENDSKPCGFIT
jgi:hypothetical protein